MIDEEKILAFLEGMSKGCCPKETKEIIINIIIPWINDLPKESVSKEFEKALAEEWQGYVDRGAATVDALEDNTQELAFAKGFYRGANWQKEQDQETIELAEDHAMLAGMNKMEQQMMTKAIDAKIGSFTNGTIYDADFDIDSNLKDNDKVKVIVIKED